MPGYWRTAWRALRCACEHSWPRVSGSLARTRTPMSRWTASRWRRACRHGRPAITRRYARYWRAARLGSPRRERRFSSARTTPRTSHWSSPVNPCRCRAGTRFTMEGWIYPRELQPQGIDHRVPGPDDRTVIDAVIFNELVNGIFSGAARREYVRVIEKLQQEGCDAVALVCTEIPLLIGPDTSPLPVLDSTRLLAHAAFEVAAGRRPMPTWRGGPPAASQ